MVFVQDVAVLRLYTMNFGVAGQDSNLRPPAYQAITLILRPLQARGEKGCFGALSTELPAT